VGGARRRQPLQPRLARIYRQAAVHRGIRHRRQAGFLQHPQAVQLADRLDDPRQHQVPEHRIPAGRGRESEHVIGMRQRIGGCPFAPSATGNIATEDLAYALTRSNISTGIDMRPRLGFRDR